MGDVFVSLLCPLCKGIALAVIALVDLVQIREHPLHVCWLLQLRQLQGSLQNFLVPRQALHVQSQSRYHRPPFVYNNGIIL